MGNAPMQVKPVGDMPAKEIPSDVWSVISSHVVNPKTHIVISQVSQTARASYSGEERWKQLCRSIGIGLGMLEKKDVTWKRALIEVVSHRKGCRMPQCYQYGVPPMNVVGDLLPDANAVLQHAEYLKGKEKPKAPVLCTCGHYHDDDEPVNDAPAGPESVEGDSEDDDEDDEDDDEDSEGSGDDNDDGSEWESDVEDEDEPDQPANPHTHTHAPDPAVMMAGLLSMMGMGPVPPNTGDMFVPPTFPGFPGFAAPQAPGDPNTYINNPPFGFNPNANPFDPNANPFLPPIPISTSAPKKSSTGPAAPTVKPHLLPLSWKNREHVPSLPKLHSFLAETGAIQFQRFLAGETCISPYSLEPTVGSKVPVGIDWDEPYAEGGDWKARNIMKLRDHPLLARAFATNPPTAKLNFVIDGIVFEVINRDGVTIKDVIHNLQRVLSKPLSPADKKTICTAPPPHDCHLDDYKTRLEFLLRDFPSRAGHEEDIKECWLRGSVQTKDGEVTCALFP